MNIHLQIRRYAPKGGYLSIHRDIKESLTWKKKTEPVEYSPKSIEVTDRDDSKFANLYTEQAVKEIHQSECFRDTIHLRLV